jgi:3-hydroxyisobutyrate dehydrogenase-like beta-hydroxyacid dehydrogenase
MTVFTKTVAGYPMARNLRAKIPAEDTLFVQDVNTAATKKFLGEHPQGVQVADNVREVAEKAVCMLTLLFPPK